jgi:EcsC protein family
MAGLLDSTRATGKKVLSKLHVTDSETFWRHLADRHGVWLPDLNRIKDVPLERLDAIAKTLIRQAERTALVQGVGLGFGGAATVLPDASLLSAILLRLTRRLCLLYGIESQDSAERAEMWKTTAAAAGVDYTKGLAEKHVLKKFASHIAERLSSRVGAEVAGKWAARLVPFANSAIGGAANFSLVRAWGRRLHADLRDRYLAMQSEALDPSASNSAPGTAL